jgi:ABC-type transporter Mla MlaB component
MSTIVLVLSGSISPTDMWALCRRIELLLEGSEADVVICDVEALSEPDAVTIDALARLQLTARRLGCRVRLRHAYGELIDLLVLTGLAEVVPCEELPLESSGQAEEREPPGRVEEEADPRDPIA